MSPPLGQPAVLHPGGQHTLEEKINLSTDLSAYLATSLSFCLARSA